MSACSASTDIYTGTLTGVRSMRAASGVRQPAGCLSLLLRLTAVRTPDRPTAQPLDQLNSRAGLRHRLALLDMLRGLRRLSPTAGHINRGSSIRHQGAQLTIPIHTEHWYRKCLHNHPPAIKKCNHLEWVENMAKGSAGLTGIDKKCRGALCQDKASAINLQCTFALCLKCCKNVALKIPAIAPALPSDFKSVLQMIPPATHQPPQTTEISRGQDADVEARLEQENSHTIDVRWWATDGGEPLEFWIACPTWPGFHPKDSPDLVRAVKSDVCDFQFFDWKKWAWINGSPLSPSRNVKKTGELCYRTLGVTTGVDMPSPSPATKRPADVALGDELEHSSSNVSTPRKIKSSFPPTPISLCTGGSGVSDWTPLTQFSSTTITPTSCGSSVPPTPSTSRSSTTSPPSRDLLVPTRSRSPSVDFVDDADPSQFSNDHHNPLPALLPTLLEAQITKTSPPSQPSVPQGARAVWPFRYVCDMAPGFARMRDLQAQGVQLVPAFEAAFGVKYKKSTYFDNAKAWSSAGLIDGEQQRWIDYGRTPHVLQGPVKFGFLTSPEITGLLTELDQSDLREPDQMFSSTITEPNLGPVLGYDRSLTG
ncbi:hypothetical protein C8Q76DRAFT_690545 [Earliella scabrosa]|nr:hypothetical protein C8Q76DRAFT_690545 [Earliella scabrosa]